MKLCTIQPQEFYDNLQRKGTIRCDARKSPILNLEKANNKKFNLKESTFERSYKWMIEQMKKRNFQKDNRYPLWAYHSIDKLNRLPTINFCRRSFQDYGSYKLTIDVPDDLVLLSDFDSWHAVLNNYHVDDDFENTKTYTKKQIEKSWQQIFDLSLIDQTQSFIIQACFPYLKKEWVIKVQNIKNQ